MDQYSLSISQDQNNKNDENTYLLQITCTPSQLSQILGVDEIFLHKLNTQQQLCVPINKIKELSSDYIIIIRKNINKIYSDIEQGKQQIDNQSGDIDEYLVLIENNDASNEEKNEYSDEINQIITEIKEKFEKVKENFNAQLLQTLNHSLRENIESINTFNEKVKAEKEIIQKEQEKVFKDLQKIAEENNLIKKDEVNLFQKNDQLKLMKNKQEEGSKQIYQIEREIIIKKFISAKYNLSIQKNENINKESVNNNQINNMKLLSINSELKVVEEQKKYLENDHINQVEQYNQQIQNLWQISIDNNLNKHFLHIHRFYTQSQLLQFAKNNHENKVNEYNLYKQNYNKQFSYLLQQEQQLINDKNSLGFEEENSNKLNEFQEQILELESQISEYQINIQETKDQVKYFDEQSQQYQIQINYLQDQIANKKLDYNNRYQQLINLSNELQKKQEALTKLIAPQQFLSNLSDALEQLQIVYDSYSEVEQFHNSILTNNIICNFNKYQKELNKNDNRVEKNNIIYKKSIKNVVQALKAGYENIYNRSTDLYNKSKLSNEKIQSNQMMYFQIKDD